jgi:hypothetical protein
MRFIRSSLLALATIALCAQAAAQKLEAGDADIARPGGVYNLLTATSADACASLCAEDGICAAWTYQPGGDCELKAVIPSPEQSAGARSGLSARTPNDLREADAALVRALAPTRVLAAAPSPPRSSATPHRSDGDDLLLGGVGDDEPGYLRPRLGFAVTR